MLSKIIEEVTKEEGEAKKYAKKSLGLAVFSVLVGAGAAYFTEKPFNYMMIAMGGGFAVSDIGRYFYFKRASKKIRNEYPGIFRKKDGNCE